MTTDTDQPGPSDGEGADARPNASPELHDAIRSIDAIGENAWGKDDDEDASRGAPAGDEAAAATDPSLQDIPEGNPDAP